MGEAEEVEEVEEVKMPAGLWGLTTEKMKRIPHTKIDEECQRNFSWLDRLKD